MYKLRLFLLLACLSLPAALCNAQSTQLDLPRRNLKTQPFKPVILISMACHSPVIGL